jgi:hypothetical protein
MEFHCKKIIRKNEREDVVMLLKKNRRICSKINMRTIYFGLLVITPFIDTINGWYVLKYGETGVSVGTFYRLLVIAYTVIFCFSKVNKKHFFAILSMLYFPISSIIRALAGTAGGSYFSAFTYGLKWTLPMIIICGIVSTEKNDNENIPLKILISWTWIIPLLLIIEYILGIGEQTYFDAGFRGLYYCTNDIGYSLSMMMIYSLYRFFFKQCDVTTGLPVALNVIAIVILSTKSCFIFFVVTFFLFTVKKFSEKRVSKKMMTFMALIIIIGLVGGAIILRDELTAMLTRYINFYTTEMSNGYSLKNLLGFLTSARTNRIDSTIAKLTENFSVWKLLFGWLPPYNTGAIEMDWLDSFFQHGLVGFCILIANYKKIFINKQYKKPFQYMLIISFICAFFSGHVLNGALPSTVFSIVVGCAIYSKKNGTNSLAKECR